MEEILRSNWMLRLDKKGQFGLAFGLKTRGYFDSTMYNEPYFALRNVIARSVTSQLQFGKTKLTCHVMEVHKDYF